MRRLLQCMMCILFVHLDDESLLFLPSEARLCAWLVREGVRPREFQAPDAASPCREHRVCLGVEWSP